jgi:hypothetical protein
MRISIASFLFNAFAAMHAFADLTIGMGPFTVSVPETWSVAKAAGPDMLQASSPGTISIGKAEHSVMIQIVTRLKVGASLEDLRAYLIEKMSTSTDEGMAMIEKEWGEKSQRLNVDSLKISDPEIRGETTNRYLVTTNLSEFEVDGDRLPLINRYYWFYKEDTAYLMRIVTPVGLAERYAKVLDSIAQSVRIKKA